MEVFTIRIRNGQESTNKPFATLVEKSQNLFAPDNWPNTDESAKKIEDLLCIYAGKPQKHGKVTIAE